MREPCRGTTLYGEVAAVRAILAAPLRGWVGLPPACDQLEFACGKGRSDLFLRLEIIKQVLVLGGIAVSWPFGVSGLILGQIVVSFICFYLNSYYTGQLIGYSFRYQVRDVGPYLGAALAMGALVYTLALLPFPGAAGLLAAQVTLGSVTYF